ncbi:MAG: heparin lyase I family protein [Geminicoccaceae bacterium]
MFPILQPGGATAAELVDEFNDGELDLCVWDPRQFDYPRLIDFEEANGRKFLVNTVDEQREEQEPEKKHPCPQFFSAFDVAVDDDDLEAENLGPSLIESPDSDVFGFDAGEKLCPKGEKRGDKEIVQRNELRFRNTKKHRHPIHKPHWYQVVWRADGDIYDCGSARWVTAQWKYDDKKWPDASPFLAQRYDNGVFHISVQSGNCRCMIAKAPGDPDLEVASLLAFTDLQRPDEDDLVDIEPLKCLWTGEDEHKGKRCNPEATLRLQSLTSPAPPPLPNPKADWVEMNYLVRGSNDDSGMVEVYANGQFIVRAAGLIGYRGGKPSKVKFKFGHYRAKIPGTAQLLYDRVCMSKKAEKCE